MPEAVTVGKQSLKMAMGGGKCFTTRPTLDGGTLGWGSTPEPMLQTPLYFFFISREVSLSWTVQDWS